VRTALAVLVVALGCGPGRVVRHGKVNEDAVTQVRRTLPDVRGLPFRAPVPTLAMPPADIHATLAHEIDESYSPADLEHLQAVYRTLGFLAANEALRPALERIYDEEAAGFYDPRRKRLVLADRALHAPGFLGLLSLVTGRDVVGEFLLSHELTHALQDQHWSLPVTPEPMLDGHGDRLLARHALLEGDATLAGFAYVLRGTPDRETISWIERRLHALPADLPPEERVRRMYLAAFSRPPSPDELADAAAFLAEQRALYGALYGTLDAADERVWADLGHVLFNVKEFIYVR